MRVHPCVVIRLVLPQHICDLIRWEAHIDVEVDRNVPRAVVLLLRFRTDFEFENDRVENRRLLAVQVIPAKLRQEPDILLTIDF